MTEARRLDEALARLGEVRDEARVQLRKARVKAKLLGGCVPSERYGRYEVRRGLASGGMGEVLEAYDPMLERAVAIKLVRPDLSAGGREQLLKEALALARLNHPNVVPIHDLGEQAGRAFIVMPLLRGSTLASWKLQPRSWRTTVAAYLQAGRGLAAAHDAGLVHRDFKPANCIVDEQENRVSVLDFGLALALDPHAHAETRDSSEATLVGPSSDSGTTKPSTAPRQRVGTPLYMAPEQFEGLVPTAASDQFSFCVALYEALYDRLPFGKDPRASLQRMAAGQACRPAPPPPDSGVPRWLSRVLVRGLAAAPGDRWPSMHVLLRKLERGLQPMLARPRSLAVAGLIGVSMGALWASRVADAPPCDDTAQRIAEVWGAPQREQVSEALLATALPHAEQTAERVLPALDAFADEWTRAHADACEATYVRHEQPLEVLERRRACLHEGLVAVREAVDLLGATDVRPIDARAVDHAVEALPAIERCADPGVLAAVDPDRPSDDSPEAEGQRAQLREALVRARALETAGMYDEALDVVEPTLAAAEQLDDPALRAEARQVRGQIFVGKGDGPLAELDLTRAHREALAHAAPRVVLEAASGRAYALGIMQGSTALGLSVAEDALALARRSLPNERSFTELELTAAQILVEIGELGEAEARLRQALGEIDQESLEAAKAWEALGQVERRQQRLDAAEPAYRKTVDIREQRLGASHPATAHARANLCGTLKEQEKLSEAERECRQALEILEGQPLRDHTWIGVAQTNLGTVLLARGDHAAAESVLRNAVASLERGRGADHPDVAETRFNLARALEKGAHAEKAMHEYRMVIRIVRIAEPTLANRELGARALRNLGDALREAGQIDEAGEHYQQAQERLDATDPGHRSLLANLHNRMGRVWLARGQAERAAQEHGQALAIYEADLDPRDTKLADTRAMLDAARRTQGAAGDGGLAHCE